MEDFARRVLSRRIASSNVLAFSADAERAAAIIARGRGEGRLGIGEGYDAGHDGDGSDGYGDGDSDGLEADRSVGAEFLRRASRQGHRVHGVGNSKDARTLDEWWSSFPTPGDGKGAEVGEGERRPDWILLAVIDPPPGEEDAALSPGSASTFLSEATLTYVVLGVRARLRPKVTAGMGNDGGGGPEEEELEIEAGGLESVRTLLRYKYKVQVLSASHYHVPDPETGEGAWGPNRLLREGDAADFFRWGAEGARRGARSNRSSTFRAYLFATQGLDLAIPSPRLYVNETRAVDVSGDGVPYVECPRRHERANIEFRDKVRKGRAFGQCREATAESPRPGEMDRVGFLTCRRRCRLVSRTEPADESRSRMNRGVESHPTVLRSQVASQLGHELEWGAGLTRACALERILLDVNDRFRYISSSLSPPNPSPLLF